MAEHISVSQISKYIGQEVTVKGWVYNRTDKGKLCFLLVRDGSGFVQCVAFKGDLEPEVFDRVSRLPQDPVWVRDLAQAVQMETASLYYHYPSKQDILVDLFNCTMHDMITGVEQAAAAASASRQVAVMRA